MAKHEELKRRRFDGNGELLHEPLPQPNNIVFTVEDRGEVGIHENRRYCGGFRNAFIGEAPNSVIHTVRRF